uniref:Uncharacterized protein n=1 Tax=Candidatus Kentrum sp. TUN TaxID=2126343 RepID=A0A451AFY9_9GAMM|nr:MAG: hypothetical protein BECKTUN1418D_GA0071000_13022 [Candidatus Kentron sp. TUN]
MTYSEFQSKESELLEALRTAAITTMIGMGEDIKGVEWFSVMAKEYCKAKFGGNVVFTSFADESNLHRADNEEKEQISQMAA